MSFIVEFLEMNEDCEPLTSVNAYCIAVFKQRVDTGKYG